MSERLKSLIPWSRRNSQVETAEQLPYDMYIVVVDDEDYYLKQTNTELTEFLENFPQLSTRVSIPKNVGQVIKEALRGNRGNQANIVVLDHALENNEGNWNLRAGNIISTCNKLGIKFPITDSGRSVPYDIVNRRINELTDRNGYYLGLVLRMAGYTGNICVLSNKIDPWDADYSQRKIQDMLETIPDLSIQTPVIDRVLPKVGFTASHSFQGVVPHSLLNKPKS